MMHIHNNIKNNSMPMNCGMKGMHEGSNQLKTEQNGSNNTLIKDTQKISAEKHKGNHIDFKV